MPNPNPNSKRGQEQQLANLAWEMQVRSVRGEKGDLEKKVKLLAGQLEAQAKELDSALFIKRSASRKPCVIPAHKGKASYSTAVAIASDWHCEEEVLLATTNGLNEFSLEIADHRIRRFFDNLINLVNLQRHGTDIDTLVLGMLGDFITNTIHDELLETNNLAPLKAIAWVMQRIRDGLATLRARGGFKRIVIPCCHGNHARLTHRQRIKTRAQNSLEWLMYHLLSQEFTEGFDWQIAAGYHVYLQVFDKWIRAHHGDALKYQGGIGGITIPVLKAIAAWDKSRPADLDIFGHWHQSLAHRKFVANGALIGFSDFSVEIKAEYEPPSQTFFLLEQRHGRTITAPIFL